MISGGTGTARGACDYDVSTCTPLKPITISGVRSLTSEENKDFVSNHRHLNNSLSSIHCCWIGISQRVSMHSAECKTHQSLQINALALFIIVFIATVCADLSHIHWTQSKANKKLIESSVVV